MANDMCDKMGPPPKVNQVPGHPLGEEALVNLYLLFREHPQLKNQITVPVNEENYLKLAEFWIENRGNHQGRSLNWGSYAQDDVPVFEQQEMEGHAVRDGLLCAGIVAAGNVTDRERLSNNRTTAVEQHGSLQDVCHRRLGCLYPRLKASVPITICQTKLLTAKSARPWRAAFSTRI